MKIYHNIQKNSIDTYIYRAYEKEGTLRYKFSIIITKRDEGLWECSLWNTIKLLWPELPVSDYVEPFSFIDLYLEKNEPEYKSLIATVDYDRIFSYRRMARKKFNLIILGEVSKIFNGVKGNFYIIKLQRK